MTMNGLLRTDEQFQEFETEQILPIAGYFVHKIHLHTVRGHHLHDSKALALPIYSPHR